MERVNRLTGSLRFRLPLLVVAVALPAVILTIWTGLETRRDSADSAREQALQAARGVSNNYRDAVRGAQQLTVPLASIFGLAETLEDIDNAVCVAFFGRIIDEDSPLPFIGVADARGNVVCTSEGDPAGHEVAQTLFFQSAVTSDATTVGRFRTNSVTGQRVISVAKSIFNATGERTGVLFVDLDIERLSPQETVQALPGGSFATVIDREGTVLARYPVVEDLVGTSVADGAGFQRISDGGEGTFEATSAEGVDSLISFTSIDLPNDPAIAFVSVGLPASEAYGPANAALVRNMIILGAVTIGALVAGRIAAEPWIFRPIDRLAEQSEEIASGGLDARIGPDYPSGELGQLSLAFDSMADRIQFREEEIRQLNATLEARVEQRTEQLQEANQELEAFSYSVSHDLRAPIRSIDGFSRILLEDYAEQLPAEARRYLDLVVQSSVTMTALIDDLLHFSRIGRASMERRETRVDGVVQDALEEVRAEIGDRKIDFQFAELGTANMDPALMRRVYANLLSNAIKFTRKVDSARVEVGRQMQDGVPVYFVKDNGAGFDMKYADKLFGVFQRLHHADEFEGTGVGLATAHRVVTRHGGRIWAESAPGEGAAFFFTIGPPDAQDAEGGPRNGR